MEVDHPDPRYPPPLKRLVKAVEPASPKGRSGATYEDSQSNPPSLYPYLYGRVSW